MEGAQCREVGRHGVIREEAPHHLRQPLSLFGNGLMHPPSQFLLDLHELCPHAITPGSPFKEEFAPSGLTADVGEPKNLKVSGFPSPRRARLSTAWRPNPIRRVFSKLSDSENSCNRSRITSQKRRASASCSNPTMMSSA